MNALDYLAFQEDMEARYQEDYTLWIMAHELDYWMKVLVAFTLTLETDEDWMY